MICNFVLISQIYLNFIIVIFSANKIQIDKIDPFMGPGLDM